MAEHTPGPWEWWTSNSWKRLYTNVDGRHFKVLVPFTNRHDNHPDLDVSEEDMALIAAAPELLAKCKELLSILEGLSLSDKENEKVHQGWKLIAKARGQETGG